MASAPAPIPATDAPIERPRRSPVVDPVLAGQLLVEAAAGDTDSFTELVMLCRPLVRCVARRIMHAEYEIDDIAQEVWTKLFVHCGRITNPDALVGWLVTVTRRAALGQVRGVAQRDQRMTRIAQACAEPSAEDAAVEHLVCQSTVAAVRQALSTLDASDRQLLVLLHSPEEHSYAEIGQRVGRPVGSLGPTRRRLLDRLGRQESVRALGATAVG